MRTLLAFVIALIALPSVTAAQAIAAGTVEIATFTGLTGNRQTVSTTVPEDQPQVGDVGFTSVNLGLETSYYLGARVSIGLLVSHQRMSVDVPDRDAVAKLSGSYYGPLLQVRLPVDTRSAFVISGSAGGIRTVIVNHNTGFADEIDLHALGRYWLAGGGLSVGVNDRLSFDAVVRYQSSTFTTPGSPAITPSGKATSAGLLVGIGLAVYIP